MSKNRHHEFYEMDRKYSVPSSCGFRSNASTVTVHNGPTMLSDDLHAWQNLNSDFADNALESHEKAPLPYGDFQLRDTTIQSIITDPRYGPKSYLGSNIYNYLKFGLPRVLPLNNSDKTSMSSVNRFTKRDSKNNRISKECSSGYDSSENDTSTIQNKRKLKKFGKKYSSNPDFQISYLTPNSIHENYHQSESTNKLLKIKSNSEANLLSNDTLMSYDIHKQSIIAKENDNMLGGNSSCLSNGISMVHDKHPVFTYPHLQIKNLETVDGIKNVTFEIHGGEIMALIATDDIATTSLLELISGNNKKYRNGDIYLNGHNITINLKMLHSKVAFIKNNINFCPEMSVEQTLRFYYLLKKPTAKLKHLRINGNDRISALLEDLGLDQIRSTIVKNLTISEKRRLNVACHLLLDTDIVLLEKPTESMDIFDTFFLIEYLRQWANGGSGHLIGRAIILSLQPPTFEIFSMLSKIILLSNGKMMYYGKRQHMMSYFANIGFPCPQFKNPADYYLDLVTLDDLSADAYTESSQRIEFLAESFQRKQTALEYTHPGPFPLSITYSNCLKQFYVLFIKEAFYKQPISFIKWMIDLLLFVTISIIIGLIFWDIPNTDSQLNLNDRIGYHFSMINLIIWPLLLYKSRSFAQNFQYLQKDLLDDLYGPKIYTFTKIITQTIPSLLIWISYLSPAYLMNGLYLQKLNDNYFGLHAYLITMIPYCYSLELLSMTLHSTVGYSIFLIIALLIFLNSNIILHINDTPNVMKWLKMYFPVDKLIALSLSRELSPLAITSSSSTTLCRNKQVQRHDIIVQLPCPPPNGTHVLIDYSLPIYINESNTIYNNEFLIKTAITFIIIVLIVCKRITVLLKNLYKN